MKLALSLLAVIAAVAVSFLFLLLFAMCMKSDSDTVQKAGFVFVIFAPTIALLIASLLVWKTGASWLIAPLGCLAAAVSYLLGGYVAEWATMSFAAKQVSRGFWAIYWVGGFFSTVASLLQLRGLWRFTFIELKKRPNQSPEPTRSARGSS